MFSLFSYNTLVLTCTHFSILKKDFDFMQTSSKMTWWSYLRVLKKLINWIYYYNTGVAHKGRSGFENISSRIEC